MDASEAFSAREPGEQHTVLAVTIGSLGEYLPGLGRTRLSRMDNTTKIGIQASDRGQRLRGPPIQIYFHVSGLVQF